MNVNAPLAVRLAVLKKALARVRAKAQLDGDIVGNDFTVDLPTPVRQARAQPCSHPGCSSHVSHPCEGCGRVWGKEKEGDAIAQAQAHKRDVREAIKLV